MKLKVIVHKAEEGGYWAEVPAIRGCVSQGETMDDLLVNVKEAVEGCLAVMEEDAAGEVADDVEVVEVAV